MSYDNLLQVQLGIPGNMNREVIAGFPPNMTFTIKKIEDKELEFRGESETAPVVFFEETAKYLKLSGGRLAQLSALFGNEIPVGKKVHIRLSPQGQAEFRPVEN